MRKQTHILKRLSVIGLSIMIATAFMPFSGMQAGSVYAEEETQASETATEETVETVETEATNETEETTDLQETTEAAEHATGGVDESSPAGSIHEDGAKKLKSTSIPSSYDSRKYGYVTPVRDQGWLGICWSFATIAAIESSILAHGQKKDWKTLDLSERQLAYFSYNLVPDAMKNTAGDKNLPKNEGCANYIENTGNAWITTEVMASGIGVVKDSVAPTPALVKKWDAAEWTWSKAFNKKTKLATKLARGANAWRLTKVKRIAMKDRTDVKKAIMEYGGLAALTYLDPDDWVSWNEDTAAYYNDSIPYSNHLITIVGWNDNYSRLNFYEDEDAEIVRPKNNGAWLCKNSYGSAWGKKGYYWISYDDLYFNDEEIGAAAYAFNVKPVPKSEILYQYDGAAGDCWNEVQSGGSIANMYKVKGSPGHDEVLKSVCLTLLNDTNVNYSIQVYTNCKKAGDPTSGKPAFKTPQTGRTTYNGFYTIPLKQEVKLKKWSKFSVVVTLSHDNNEPVRYDVDSTCWNDDWVKYVSAVKANQSFERDTKGAAWDDLSLAVKDGEDQIKCAARVKAITKPGAVNKSKNPFAVKAKTATIKYKKLKKKTQTLSVAKVMRFTKSVGDKKNYTLSSVKKGKKSYKKYVKINKKTGRVTIKKTKKMKKGTYKITVKVKALGNVEYKASTWKTVTFKVKVK